MTTRSNKPRPARRGMADLHTPTTPTHQTALPPSRPVGKTRTPREVLMWRERGKGKRGEIPVVEIHWVDAVAVAPEHWEDETDISLDPAPSLAVGYLIGETDTTYTVISLVNESHYAHGITIPKGCVTKVVRLA